MRVCWLSVVEIVGKCAASWAAWQTRVAKHKQAIPNESRVGQRRHYHSQPVASIASQEDSSTTTFHAVVTHMNSSTARTLNMCINECPGK